MQLAQSNSAADASLNALLLPGAVPSASGTGLSPEARAAFPQFESFMAGLPVGLSDAVPAATEIAWVWPLSRAGEAEVVSCGQMTGQWVSTPAGAVNTLLGVETRLEEPALAGVGPAKEKAKPAQTSMARGARTTTLKEKAPDAAAHGEPVRDAMPDSVTLAAGIVISVPLPLEMLAPDNSAGDVFDETEATDQNRPEVKAGQDASDPSDNSQAHEETVATSGFARNFGAPPQRVQKQPLLTETTSRYAAPERIVTSDATMVAQQDPTVEKPAQQFDQRNLSESRGAGRLSATQPQSAKIPVPLPESVESLTKLTFQARNSPALFEPSRTFVGSSEIAPLEVALTDPAKLLGDGMEPPKGVPSARTEPRAEIAAAFSRRGSEFDTPESVPEKNFVSAERELLTPRRQILGTDVAKLAPTMASRSSTPLADSPAFDRGATVSLVSDSFREVSEKAKVELPVELSPVRAAHEAVEVVLQAAEQLASRDQKSVRLQFSVGDARLEVRVELHANEVRTQFRTDSAELRQALSHEWQSVSSGIGGGERGLRMAPAVFSSSSASDQSAFNAFAGDTPSRQREHRASRDANARAPRAIASVTSGRAAADAVSVSPRPLRSAPLTSQHLHTLA